ncbi:MAG TPA: LytTR family DNA-binding domain-containing protein, partial [Flavobacteriales bacterium]|nr:LytTR family DNA-binding domain-containing protein [Flavobacteriales bacterium]
GISMINDYHPDLVFLDISMPDMNGFELLEKTSYKDFKLVFVTAHQEYAIQAIKNSAFDYLLKPVDADDLKKCLERIESEKKGHVVNGAQSNYKTVSTRPVEISVKDGIIYLKQTDIVRLEASRSYTVFYLDGGVKHVASRSLKEYEAYLDTSVFYRCHNSHVVNLQKVQKFINRDGFFAQMKDGSVADVSKTNKEEFLYRLKSI